MLRVAFATLAAPGALRRGGGRRERGASTIEKIDQRDDLPVVAGRTFSGERQGAVTRRGVNDQLDRPFARRANNLRELIDGVAIDHSMAAPTDIARQGFGLHLHQDQALGRQ